MHHRYAMPGKLPLVMFEFKVPENRGCRDCRFKITVLRLTLFYREEEEDNCRRIIA